MCIKFPERITIDEMQMLDFEQIAVFDATGEYEQWSYFIKKLWGQLQGKRYIRKLTATCGFEDVIGRLREINLVVLLPLKLMREAHRIRLVQHTAGKNGGSAGDHASIDTMEDELKRKHGFHPACSFEKHFHRHIEGRWREELLRRPRAGFLPDEGGDPHEKTRVVTESLGIYVSSLARWLDLLRSKIDTLPTPETGVLLERFASWEKPAILLCPKLIDMYSECADEFFDDYSIDIEPEDEEESPPPWEKLEVDLCHPISFLKIVLYHEAGHHIFPCQSTYWGELFANWFCHNTISTSEQVALELFSGIQPWEYAQYTSLVHLEQANPLFEPWAFWPLAPGRKLTDVLEKNAFHDRLDSFSGPLGEWKRLMGNFLHWYRNAMGIFYFDHPFVHNYLAYLFEENNFMRALRAWVLVHRLLKKPPLAGKAYGTASTPFLRALEVILLIANETGLLAHDAESILRTLGNN